MNNHKLKSKTHSNVWILRLIEILRATKHHYCCESDSKLEKLKFAESVKIGARMELSGARIWVLFFVCWFGKNQWPNGGIRGPNFPAKNITETYFWAEILFQFMRDTFTINIDIVSV